MRVLLFVICACVGAALGEPQTGGIYLPVAARDSSTRRFPPVAVSDPGRRYRPSPSASGPSSRRYLPVGRGAPRANLPSPPPRRPVFGGQAPFPSDVFPDVQYRPDTLQTPDVAPYQPSSAEVPPPRPALTYQPQEPAASRRYLPAKESTRGRTTYQAPTGGSGYGSQNAMHPPANYDFEYHVLDAESGNDFGQREGRRGDLVTGSYHVVLPDGRKQVVDYVADLEGYRPVVSYEGAASNRGGAEGYSYNKPEGYSYNQPRPRS